MLKTALIAGDFNGHVGERNLAIERVHGRYGSGAVNPNGERLIDFAVAYDLAILNTFFKKKDYNTYESGGQETQLDYILYKRSKMSEVRNFKTKTREVCFRERVLEQIELREGVEEWWNLNASMIRQAAEEMLGMTSGKGTTNDKETCEQSSKKAVAVAKAEAREEMYQELDTRGGQKKIYRIAKARDKSNERSDTYQAYEGYRRKCFKGNIQDCTNYRGIKLISHTMKLWERTIGMRIEAETVISENQFGFVKGRQTSDAIFALRQTMEKDVTSQVSSCVGITDEFNIKVGLHQGSTLSPYIFDLIMDVLSEGIQEEAPWTMLFADDIVLVCKTKESLREKLSQWKRALEDRGLKISRTKSEYLSFNDFEEKMGWKWMTR
nr:uncharacterized protein LOC113813143 [Penaeus vannamei]